jgi:hypothetical protein
MRTPGRRDGAGLVLALAAILGAAACAPDGPSPSGVPLGSASPPPVSVAPSSGAPATAPASSAGAGVVGVDGGLLDVLPAQVGSAVLTEDAETAAGIATDVSGDPDLAADLADLAVGLYASQTDYAVVTVTRLRDGVFDEDWFRDWRDSFDDAVCSQAGGIDGHAEAPIDGRTAYIGTCTGGVRTYHVRLSDPDRIVSLQALGEARYGELILGGLEE